MELIDSEKTPSGWLHSTDAKESYEDAGLLKSTDEDTGDDGQGQE